MCIRVEMEGKFVARFIGGSLGAEMTEDRDADQLRERGYRRAEIYIFVDAA